VLYRALAFWLILIENTRVYPKAIAKKVMKRISVKITYSQHLSCHDLSIVYEM